MASCRRFLINAQCGLAFLISSFNAASGVTTEIDDWMRESWPAGNAPDLGQKYVHPSMVQSSVPSSDTVTVTPSGPGVTNF
jgi:hypothetical protein